MTPSPEVQTTPTRPYARLNGPVEAEEKKEAELVPTPPPVKVTEDLTTVITQLMEQVPLPPPSNFVEETTAAISQALERPPSLSPPSSPSPPPEEEEEPEQTTPTEPPRIVKIVTPEPFEVVEGVRISHVQRTRWTPQSQSSSPHWTQQYPSMTSPPIQPLSPTRQQPLGRQQALARQQFSHQQPVWQQRQQPVQYYPQPSQPLYPPHPSLGQGRQQPVGRTRSTPVGQREVSMNRHNSVKAYATRASDVRELCSRCRRPFGTDLMMAIPALRVQYHGRCFACNVCRSPLAMQPQNMTVLVQNNLLHCPYCYSNAQG